MFLKEQGLTAIEKALEEFENKNGFSVLGLRDPRNKARFMRFGGIMRNNKDNDFLEAAFKYQQELFLNKNTDGKR